MIDWVDDMCRAWGRARRRIELEAGPQPKSLSGKLMEEGEGAAMVGHYRPSQGSSLEVMTGAALKVRVAILILLDLSAKPGRRLTEAEYEALFVRYVIPGRWPDGTALPMAEKARRMGKSPRRLYQLVDVAHSKLETLLEE